MLKSGGAPVFVRGEGIRIWDQEGNSYIDGLAGLFSVQIGHGRADIAAAAGEQMRTLAYMPSWSATTPPTIEASNLIASLAPGDLDVVFLVSSGSEAVESAIKFSRQYHSARNEPRRVKVISRNLSYHGTTLGALSATGLTGIREAYGPLLYGFRKVPNTLGFDDGVEAAARVEEAIIEEGPESVGMVLAEPVQNGGGSIVPPAGYWQELRRICDKIRCAALRGRGHQRVRAAGRVVRLRGDGSDPGPGYLRQGRHFLLRSHRGPPDSPTRLR